MPFRETLWVALEALRTNKLRSSLTMLGIVIGIAAVIAMIALGRGARESVKERITALGTNLITVFPGQARGFGGLASSSDRAELTIDDARALAERGTAIAAVQPEVSRQLQVQWANQNTNTTVVGVTSNYLEVRRYGLTAGRMFTAGDDAARRRYAVLGSQVLEDMGMPSPSAMVGEQLRIGSVQFEVIGVLESKGGSGGWFNPDDQILISIDTARYRLLGTDQLRSISVLATNEEDVTLAMAEIQKILRRRHRLLGDAEDDFRIRSQSDFLATLGETTQVFSLLLAGIAAVSLIVGGIGIMNIMLVSVTERTREIGIRKALGATPRTILLQFLSEALMLCLAGGAVGMALGVGSSYLMRHILNWNASVGAYSILLAFLFSAAVGLLFGVWPARRAAALDPIDALRYE